MADESLTADVVIVGGGIAGCASAWFLAREGLDVVVVERDSLAHHASGAAAGMLAPIGEGEAGSDLQQYGLASLSRFPTLCEELRSRSGIDPELEPSGILRVAVGAEQAKALETKAVVLRNSGVAVEWLDAEAACAVQPGISPDVRGALWSPAESHVRSPLLARAFAGAAQSLGARIVVGTGVVGVVSEGPRVTGVRVTGALNGTISAANVVVCAGTWSGALADWLLAALPAGAVVPTLPPVEPVRGQILSLVAPGLSLSTIVWGEWAYLVPKRDGSIVVGATEEYSGFDCRVTAGGMAKLLTAAPALLPSLRNAEFQRGWAGLRPGSPDGLPSIGRPLGVDGLVVAYGHHRSGVLFSPITGALVRDHVLGKVGRGDASAFDPSRFAE